MPGDNSKKAASAFGLGGGTTPIPPPGTALSLRRAAPAKKTVKKEEPKPVEVSAGPVENQVVELAFNPTREKLREVTVVDRMQGRLFPQLDTINKAWGYAIEIATFRMDAGFYEELYEKEQPQPPDLLDEFMYRTAQWQKSISGRNLDKATDIAMRKIESDGDKDGFGGGDSWQGE